MFFRTNPVNRPARVVAALILLGFGFALAADGGPMLILPAIALWGVGLTVLCINLYQTVRDYLRQSSPIQPEPPSDPYDLSRLWDSPLPDRTTPARSLEIEEAEREDENPKLAYCHRCGSSMPKAYAVCPGCGNRLGY